MPWRVLLVLFLWLFSWSQADELVKVRFRTDPDSVKVFMGRQPVGLSGVDLTLEIPSEGDTNIQFRFEADGYDEMEQSISVNRLKRTEVYPQESNPPIKLAPKSWLVRVKRQPLALVGLGTLFLAAGWLLTLKIRVARAEVERSRTLQRLGDSAGDGGSLLMETVGGYRLVSELGRGGMSVVYRGIPEESLDESEEVAIKVLSRDLMEDEDGVERFRREINLSKNLVHPNIVRLLDFGEHDGRLYLVQEVLSGDTLREQIPKDGLPPNKAWTFLEPIFSAVHFAHVKTIVHRDLKPENIMLNEGQVKVGDFGLAKAADSKKLTKTGTTLGTPSYMAPEQIQEANIDPSTDQYALGIIVYEMLTGQVPFDADDPIKVIFMHLMEPARPLLEIKPELGKAVSEVVSKMLEKESTDRYESIEAAGRALSEALKG